MSSGSFQSLIHQKEERGQIFMQMQGAVFDFRRGYY